MVTPIQVLATVGTGLTALWLVGRKKRRKSVQALLNGNYQWLSPAQRRVVGELVSLGQEHLVSQWPPPGVKDEEKLRLLSAAECCLYHVSESLESARLEILAPPRAEKRHHTWKLHGDEREDPYHWLRDDDKKDPAVLDHLNEENEYTDAVMADTEKLQEAIYQEMRGRIKEIDQSAPQRHNGYFYYWRTKRGQQCPIHCRRKVPNGMGPPMEEDQMDLDMEEELLLGENLMGSRLPFNEIGKIEMSPNHKLVAYTEDMESNERYDLHIRDLQTGAELLRDPIKNLSPSIAWAKDSKHLFYVTVDKRHRPCKVWRHKLGTWFKQDVLVYSEADDAFSVSLSLTRDEKMLMINTASAITSEVRYLDASRPGGTWRVLLRRARNVEYSAAHRSGFFFIDIRDRVRPNSELQVLPVGKPAQKRVLIPHRANVKVESFELSKNYIAIFERKRSLQSVSVFKLTPEGTPPALLGCAKMIQFEEPAYRLTPGDAGDFDSDIIRIHHSTMTTPSKVIDYNMMTGHMAIKRVEAVQGTFNPDNYTSTRLWALASDSTKVPISVVYRKDAVKLDGSAPLLLYVYGSYEKPIDACFSSSRISLLDRGFVYAIAHVRGGGEMGRHWYEEGKFLKKMNTFTDTIACAERLLELKYCSPNRLCLAGESAGGLAVGAALNMQPKMFSSAVMEVPFVDVLTTMMDKSLPLTTEEFEEWGNPAIEEFYHYIKSYSPMDNIGRHEYPDVLITSGFHDCRVRYFEVAKYAAKLRECKTSSSLVLFKCDMECGHTARSGRFDVLKETAFQYAFLLKSQKMLKAPPPKV